MVHSVRLPRVLVLFLITSIIFLARRTNLLLSLIVLELLSFFCLGSVAISLVRFSGSDYMLFIFFSVFVIEGVVGISGLISLVRFSGSDYMLVGSFRKC
jgi:hypothetical protein